jgi:hypothetical protein
VPPKLPLLLAVRFYLRFVDHAAGAVAGSCSRGLFKMERLSAHSAYTASIIGIANGIRVNIARIFQRASFSHTGTNAAAPTHSRPSCGWVPRASKRQKRVSECIDLDQ